MPLIYACIAPHGYQCLPELTPSPTEAAATRNALSTMGATLQSLRPDTVVVLTPHGIRIDGAMCISVSERASGSLGPDVSVDFAVDHALAHAIAEQAVADGVPVAKCIYGASGGPACNIPLDWGAIIPLRYFGNGYETKPEIVVICPSRALSREQLVQFGQGIARAAQSSGKRVALIASADQAHAHAADGPYGFDPAAVQYDRQMCEAVETGDLLGLLNTDATLIENAKPDSLWQMLILAGALNEQPLSGKLLSYEAPTYFGMLCAEYAQA